MNEQLGKISETGKFVKFCDVSPGMIFFFSGHYYHKTEPFITDSDNIERYCIEFFDGKSVYFNEDTEVRVVIDFAYKM